MSLINMSFTHFSNSTHTMNRKPVVDLVRIITSFGVISIHVHSSTISAENLGKFLLLFCVPFFYTSGLTFFVMSSKSKTDINYTVLKIFKRIILPFFIWSLIYIGLIVSKHLINGQYHSLDLIRIFLYGESAEHLYFLPQLAVLQIIALSLYLIYNGTNIFKGIILFIIPTTYLVWGYLHKYYGLNPLSNIVFYNLVAFYIVFTVKHKLSKWFTFIIGILFVTLTVLHFLTIGSAIFFSYLFILPLGGIGLFLISINSPNFTLPKWLVVIASTTYGVYLSHVLFLEILEFTLNYINYQINYDLPTKLLVTLFIFTISIFFTLVIRNFTLLKVFLLGESKLISNNISSISQTNE